MSESKRVLVVDDQQGIRMLLATFLQRDSYDVMSASNGEEGLLLLTQYSFDLLILDMQMPVLNGEQTLAKMKELGIKLPVIVITASLEMLLLNRLKELGATECLCKPIDLESLGSLINRIIQ
jgi:CheY-like chemotaxis protein